MGCCPCIIATDKTKIGSKEQELIDQELREKVMQSQKLKKIMAMNARPKSLQSINIKNSEKGKKRKLNKE